MIELDYRGAQTLTAEGNDDIDVSVGLDVPFVVVGIRIAFSDILSGGGGSTTKADVVISLVSGRDADHNVTLDTSGTDRGIGADMNLAIDPMIYERWRLDATREYRDKCRVIWTNPDPPNVGWALSIRAVPIKPPQFQNREFVRAGT